VSIDADLEYFQRHIETLLKLRVNLSLNCNNRDSENAATLAAQGMKLILSLGNAVEPGKPRCRPEQNRLTLR
jgi:hypothetical protein